MARHVLGDRLRDKVTKFEGIAVSRTQHITGCDVYGIQAEECGGDDKKAPVKWFDENRLELVKAAAVVIVDEEPDWSDSKTREPKANLVSRLFPMRGAGENPPAKGV